MLPIALKFALGKCSDPAKAPLRVWSFLEVLLSSIHGRLRRPLPPGIPRLSCCSSGYLLRKRLFAFSKIKQKIQKKNINLKIFLKFLNSFNFENFNKKKSWEIKILPAKSTGPGCEATTHLKKVKIKQVKDELENEDELN